MPTYDYRCPKCEHIEEIIHKMDECRMIHCGRCEVKMLKVFRGGTGIHFKGSGFYETDYKER